MIYWECLGVDVSPTRRAILRRTQLSRTPAVLTTQRLLAAYLMRATHIIIATTIVLASYRQTAYERTSFVSHVAIHTGHTVTLFTVWYTIVQSAVLRLHVVCPSVCDVGGSGPHIGWKSWKLIPWTIISPTPSQVVAQRPSTYSHGNVGTFWEVGWEEKTLLNFRLYEETPWLTFINGTHRAVIFAI